jgi:hypothetical protein
MGTWGSGPFDNDAAADFIGDALDSPAVTVEAALHAVADAAPGKYLDVDDGQAAHAACELIALGLGYANATGLHADVRRLAMQLRPSEALRVLALAAIPRIADVDSSEVAGLWHDGGDPEWAASLDDLANRLRAAGE